jgi:hypothetical protein
MKDPDEGGRGIRFRRFGRRGLLAGAGAGGLAAASAMFGRSSAMADNWQCCNLAVHPPNLDYDWCYAHRTYYWGCTTSGGFLHCLCCEAPGGSGGRCQYN